MSTPVAGRRVIILCPAPDSPPEAAWWCAVEATLGRESALDVVVMQHPSSAPLRTLNATRPGVNGHVVRLADDAQTSLASRVETWRAILPRLGLAAEDPALILFEPGTEAEEAAARLAQSLDGTTLGRCASLDMRGADVVGRRAVCGGRTFLEVASDRRIVVAVLRGNVQVARSSSSAMPVEWRPLDLPTPLRPVEAEEIVDTKDAFPAVDGARLVVSGGRGMGGPDGLELLGQLAQRLGAALAGSLPAVDAGWVPAARQVGQSGKFVSPSVYLAVGISGTPQHMAGIADETLLAAVNKDSDAPIFSIAQWGVVADWHEFLPLLIEAVETLKSAAAG